MWKYKSYIFYIYARLLYRDHIFDQPLYSFIDTLRLFQTADYNIRSICQQIGEFELFHELVPLAFAFIRFIEKQKNLWIRQFLLVEDFFKVLNDHSSKFEPTLIACFILSVSSRSMKYTTPCAPP